MLELVDPTTQKLRLSPDLRSESCADDSSFQAESYALIPEQIAVGPGETVGVGLGDAVITGVGDGVAVGQRQLDWVVHKVFLQTPVEQVIPDGH